jgi:hypothetical protein
MENDQDNQEQSVLLQRLHPFWDRKSWSELERELLREIEERKCSSLAVRRWLVELLVDAYRLQDKRTNFEKWAREGISMGSTTCMRLRARQLESLKDLKSKDLTEIEALYTRAANLGDTSAMNDFGVWLGERNQRKEAMKWWLRGANQNNDEECIINLNRSLQYHFSLTFAKRAEKFLEGINRVRFHTIRDRERIAFCKEERQEK